ncbi:unnamed protein product, partial [Ectocarpus sp. 4 AP-2014]
MTRREAEGAAGRDHCQRRKTAGRGVRRIAYVRWRGILTNWARNCSSSGGRSRESS